MRLTLAAALVALCLCGARAARAGNPDGGVASSAARNGAASSAGRDGGVAAAPAGRARPPIRLRLPLAVPRALLRRPAPPMTPPAARRAAPAHRATAGARAGAAAPPPRPRRARPAPAAPQGIAPCGGKPQPAGPVPFAPGELLHYDLDVLGVRAGTLDLDVARDPSGGYDLGALARSNTFFENIRKVRGRATSYVSATTLEPTRYREDATEDGVKKWADVHFDRQDGQADIAYAIGPHRRRVRYPLRYGPFDVLSVVYYVRTLPMKVGEHLCVDLYGNRKVWRLRGHVDGEEWIDTPAGKFKTWRLVGEAWRLDMPRVHRPIHLWIGQGPRRLPVAAVGEIDLGPVRAQLSRIGPAGDASQPPDYTGGTW